MQPHVREFHTWLELLHLHSWKLSSNSSARQVFSEEVAEIITKDLRKSMASLYQGSHQNIFVGIVQRMLLQDCCPTDNIEFFLYVRRELKLTVLAIKGYGSTLDQVFILTGSDLASNRIISRMFSSFKKSFVPREIKAPEWNISLALRSLTHLPYMLKKMSLDKHLT